MSFLFLKSVALDSIIHHHKKRRNAFAFRLFLYLFVVFSILVLRSYDDRKTGHEILAHLGDDHVEIFPCKAISLVGACLEHLDRPAAHRGILALKISVGEIGGVKEVARRGHAVDVVAILAKLSDLGQDRITLVPDVSDDLLEDVLHCDDSHRSAVLVKHDEHMQLLLAQLAQSRRKL